MASTSTLMWMGLLGAGGALALALRKKKKRNGVIVPPDAAAGPSAPLPDAPTPLEGGVSFVEDRIAQGVAKLKASKFRAGTRDMKWVDALVMHATSFRWGNDPSRYDGITAHFIILPDGRITQIQPLDRYLYASGVLNKYSVSVEFALNPKGSMGSCYKPEKFGCHDLTPEQVRSGRYLIRWLQDELPARGSPGLKNILTHRQSASNRSNDPGPDVWFWVGQWAVKVLGLSDGGPGYSVASGRPIKDSWRAPRIMILNE